MGMRLRSRLFAVLAVLVVAAVLSPRAVDAQSKTLRWLRWDSDIAVNSDGTMSVEENYEIEFIGGDFTFGFRSIRISRFESITGVVVSDNSSVYEESRSEAPRTFYVNRDGNEYVIYWFYPATRDAVRQFTVNYTVIGGVAVNEEIGDEAFWSAVGVNHDYPVESALVSFEVPPGAVVDTSIEPYRFGIDAPYEISPDLTRVTYHAKNIPANQEFEIGVRFRHGFVPDVAPSWQAAYERERVQQARKATWGPILNLAAGSLAILFLAGGLVGIYLLWSLVGRDPEVGDIPSHLSSPPSDLPPGLAGTLVDEKADLQDIIATLVDLARRGAIDMVEEKSGLFGMSTNVVFHRRADFTGSLRQYEATFLSQLFGGSDKIETDDLREKFYSKIPAIQKQLYQDAVELGLFPASPKVVRGRYLGLGIAGLVLSVGFGMIFAAALSDLVSAALCPFMSLGMVSFVLIFVSGVMPAKTRKGAEEAKKWEAFKRYLQDVEKYVDIETVTDQFDDFLPYAIAFGLEHTWVKKFSSVSSTPIPPWFVPVGMPYPYGGGIGRTRQGSVLGGGSGQAMPDLRDQRARPVPSLDRMSDSMMGGLNSISSGLFSALNSTSSAMKSVPRSSGSGSFGGGFSGGGFSGGGFSGGGGGGFG
jgi:uncharacterized membrane protein YgcG